MELKPDIRMIIATLAGGGSERVCMRLANHWAGQGRKVELLVVRREGCFLASLDARVQLSSAEASRTRHALSWLRQKLNRWPDVPALLFGFDFGVGLGALKRMGLISSPLIYREGSCPRSNIPRWSQWKYRAFVAASEGVVAQSNFALRNLRSLGVRSARASVIWNPLERRVAVSPVPNFPRGGLQLVAVGRLSPEKGYLRLLDAFVRMRERIPAVNLTIAGEGPQRMAIESRIRDLGLGDGVKLVGFVSDPARLFVAADVFVLSSDYEGQPNTLLEALRCGCRVIASGGEGVGEVLAKLNLSECWIEQADFTRGFVETLPRALAIDSDRLEWARAKLGGLTDIMSVGDAYFQFCLECCKSARTAT